MEVFVNKGYVFEKTISFICKFVLGGYSADLLMEKKQRG